MFVSQFGEGVGAADRQIAATDRVAEPTLLVVANRPVFLSYLPFKNLHLTNSIPFVRPDEI
jgi:hypothetical protein